MLNKNYTSLKNSKNLGKQQKRWKYEYVLNNFQPKKLKDKKYKISIGVY